MFHHYQNHALKFVRFRYWTVITDPLAKLRRKSEGNNICHIGKCERYFFTKASVMPIKAS